MTRKVCRPAPVVDAVLAKILVNRPNPLEKLMHDHGLPLLLNALTHTDAKTDWDGRIARLECGHFVVTRSVSQARCPRCGEMIRAGYDYDGFRHQHDFDEFHWPDDPLRGLNEVGS